MEALISLGAGGMYGLPGTFLVLTRSALRLKPDVISLDWIHQYTLGPSVLTSIIKSFVFWMDVLIVRYLLRKKLVWTIHNLQHHEPRPRKIETWISRYFAAHCTKIRILGYGIEPIVCEKFNIPLEKLVVIPEGSYVGWYPDTTNEAEARKKMQIAEDQKVWLYLGNLRPYKGVEDLIEAFQTLKPANTKLIIAGNPYQKDYAASLQKMAAQSPDIHLEMRLIPDAELQYFFHAAQVVVLPFRHVLNSGTVLLAMSFGKAVVAPATGLLPFRLSIQPQLLYGENEDLQSALQRAIELNSDQLNEIGKLNKAAAQKYQWADFARFLLSL